MEGERDRGKGCKNTQKYRKITQSWELQGFSDKKMKKGRKVGRGRNSRKRDGDFEFILSSETLGVWERLKKGQMALGSYNRNCTNTHPQLQANHEDTSSQIND